MIDLDQLRQLQEATDRQIIEAAKRIAEAENLTAAYTARPISYVRRSRAGLKFLHGPRVSGCPRGTLGMTGCGDWVYTSDGWRRPTPTEAHRVACGEEPW